MDIYHYDNFREFLFDAYEQKKEKISGYSYRKFARDAGISNPGYLNDVIKGTRTLSVNACEKISHGFNLTHQEAEFLLLLTQYGQAKKKDLRQELYKKIMYRRSRSSFARIKPEQSKYYEDYRYALIRTAIDTYNFKGDYFDFAEFFKPPIPVNDIKRCVRDLCKWNMIYQDAKGAYHTTYTVIEPPPTLKGLIREINKEWIDQAKEAIDLFTPEERHISTILLSVSNKNAKKILTETEEFRKKIFSIIQDDTTPEQVMQLNIQVFPKTTTQSKRDKS
ncbi:MAG: TIGR02147 family protein [Fibrobacterales bacterium]